MRFGNFYTCAYGDDRYEYRENVNTRTRMMERKPRNADTLEAGESLMGLPSNGVDEVGSVDSTNTSQDNLTHFPV